MTLLGAFVPIVAAVALVVQQLDNELLAPWIYGKSLQLHPLVILLGITAGTALFGFVGALLAVPVLAVTLNVIDEARNPVIERRHGDIEASPTPESTPAE